MVSFIHFHFAHMNEFFLSAETVKNEYREMIDSFKAAWALVGHKLKNHGIVHLVWLILS